MPAVGLTDHGTFAGAISFLKECRKCGDDLPEDIRDQYPDGIKPILGMEAYMCRNHLARGKEEQPDGRKGNRHVNIIAKNSKGFSNLCSLSQIASLEGYYYDPRLDLELLDKYKEGIIITSACLSNIVNALLMHDKYDAASRAAGQFKEIFGDDYYLEMMYHGIEAEAKILPGIQKIASKNGIKTIISNDCHYLTKADAEFHEYLLCMSSGKSIRDPKRMKFPFEEFYFKSEAEMQKIFGHCPQSLRNTLEIAEKCDYSDMLFIEDGGEMRLPVFELPEGETDPYSYLEKLCWEGFKREGWENSVPHKERLTRELDDVKLIWDTKRYDFSTYFLIVEGIMKFAKENNIASGVRGSGYGSLLLKCLGIVEGIDPLAYDLLWERFLGFDWSHFISENDFGCKRL